MITEEQQAILWAVQVKGAFLGKCRKGGLGSTESERTCVIDGRTWTGATPGEACLAAMRSATTKNEEG